MYHDDDQGFDDDDGGDDNGRYDDELMNYKLLSVKFSRSSGFFLQSAKKFTRTAFTAFMTNMRYVIMMIRFYCAPLGDGLLFTFPGSLHTCTAATLDFRNP